MKLTQEEQAAITALKRLARRWPQSLYLFSASGSLLVVKTDEGGGLPHTPNGSVDNAFVVEHVHGIPNDGGDF